MTAGRGEVAELRAEVARQGAEIEQLRAELTQVAEVARQASVHQVSLDEAYAAGCRRDWAAPRLRSVPAGYGDRAGACTAARTVPLPGGAA